jgi:hypothetical protein
VDRNDGRVRRLPARVAGPEESAAGADAAAGLTTTAAPVRREQEDGGGRFGGGSGDRGREGRRASRSADSWRLTVDGGRSSRRAKSVVVPAASATVRSNRARVEPSTAATGSPPWSVRAVAGPGRARTCGQYGARPNRK